MAATRWLLSLLLLALLLAATTHAIDIPDFVPNVVDTTGTLSREEIQTLNRTIADLRDQSRIWAAVLVVRSLGSDSIEQVAVEVFERWELGKRGVDNGLLILVAKDDRKVRLEVGYGLEGSIPDASAKRIIRDVITPKFREGQFFEGLNTALAVCNELVAGGQFPERIKETSSEPDKSYVLPVIIWFILIVVAPAVMRAMAVSRSLQYPEELQATAEERKWSRIIFLSGVGSFLTVFLLINPGIFFVTFWHEMPLVAPAFILFAYLFLLAANSGYVAMLSEARRAKFRKRRSRSSSDSDSPQAFDVATSSGSGSNSDSSSSSSSSSSGGGRSGGGGASGSW